MKRYLIYILLALVVSETTVKGEVEPTSAPDQETFSLAKDNYTIFSNSINTLTGEVAFSLSLANIPGRNGHGFDIAATYTSAGSYYNYTTWNAEAPTGILGMGWNVSIPKIVVDNKMTATRHDDEFYLISGGKSTKLIRYKRVTSYVYFRSDEDIVGEYIYNSLTEKWTVRPGDGNTYIYGDESSGRNTVEWVIHWDNWIGNSSNTANQSRQGIAWNLSEVTNRWEESVIFTYTNIERYLKTGQGLKHTEASYLTKIETTLGYYATLQYHVKDPAEYFEENIEVTEPYTGMGSEGNEGDAYQERIEKEFLSGIRLYNERQELVREVELSYNVQSVDNFSKRFLTGIRELTRYGSYTGPGVKFNYNYSGVRSGSMSQVTTNSGARVNFNYNISGSYIPNSNRSITSLPPSDGNYGEPRVYMGRDYAIVSWRELKYSDKPDNTSYPRNMRLLIYNWEGGWKKDDLEVNIADVEIEGHNYKDLQVVLEEDFFAFAHKKSQTQHKLFLVSRNSKTKDWSLDTRLKDFPITSDGIITIIDEANLFSGSQFVGLGSKEMGFVYIYRLEETLSTNPNWEYEYIQGTTVESVSNVYSYGAVNNYFIRHAGKNNPDEITIFYLDEFRQWQSKAIPGQYSFNSSTYLSYWYPSNSFAFVMAEGNNEFAFIWDENYNVLSRHTIADNWNYDEPHISPVFINNTNQISLSAKGVPKATLRCGIFDGTAWHLTLTGETYQNGYGASISFGKHLAIWHKTDNRKGGMFHYDLNSRIWNTSEYSLLDNGIGNGNALSIGFISMFHKNRFYALRNNGNIEIECDISLNNDSKHFIASGDYYYFTSGSNKIIYKFKNGQLQAPKTISGYLNHGGYGLLNNYISINQNMFVGFNNAGQVYSTEARLYNYLNGDVTGLQKVYPIKSVTISNGLNQQLTSYQFETENAKMSDNAQFAYYNQVDIIQGSDATTREFGYTRLYQFNGLSSSESGRIFPLAGGGNADEYYDNLIGQIYAKELYENQEGSLIKVSEEWISYNTVGQDFTNEYGKKVHRYYISMPIYHYSEINGVSKVVESVYSFQDTYTPLLTDKITYNIDAQNNEDTYWTEYTYWYEAYDPDLSENFVGPVVQKKSLVNGTTVDVSATKWKNFGGDNWKAYEEYIWKGTGNDNFTAWGLGTNPTTDWKRLNQITSIDSKGNVLSSINEDGIVTENSFINYNLLTQRKQYPQVDMNNAIVTNRFYDDYNNIKQETSNLSNQPITNLLDEYNALLTSFDGRGVMSSVSHIYNPYAIEPTQPYDFTNDQHLIHQSTSSEYDNLYDDFEGYHNIDGASVPIGDATPSIRHWSKSDNRGVTNWRIGRNSLFMSTSTTGSSENDYLYIENEEKHGRVAVEFSVFKKAGCNNRDFGFSLGDEFWNPGYSTENFVQLAFRDNQIETYYDGSWHVLGSTKIDEYFHRIKLLVDTNAETVDYYLDGKLLLKEAPYRNQSTSSGVGTFALDRKSTRLNSSHYS